MIVTECELLPPGCGRESPCWPSASAIWPAVRPPTKLRRRRDRVVKRWATQLAGTSWAMETATAGLHQGAAAGAAARRAVGTEAQAVDRAQVVCRLCAPRFRRCVCQVWRAAVIGARRTCAPNAGRWSCKDKTARV